ncbi:MAG: hypothetical protein RL645_295 [Actinomycetota bacterium]|jgi:DNA-binding transcriptional ArsR family regulator
MSDIFSAIADPIRRQILDALAAKPGLSVSELVAATKQGQPAVSKHLKTLRDANLVSVKTVGQNRFYSLNAEALKPVATWVLGHAAAKVEAEVSERAEDLAEKLGELLANGADWLGEKVAERTKVRDANDVGRELGRRLAEARAQADKTIAAKTGKDIDALLKDAQKVAKDASAKVQAVADKLK